MLVYGSLLVLKCSTSTADQGCVSQKTLLANYDGKFYWNLLVTVELATLFAYGKCNLALQADIQNWPVLTNSQRVSPSLTIKTDAGFFYSSFPAFFLHLLFTCTHAFHSLAWDNDTDQPLAN